MGPQGASGAIAELDLAVPSMACDGCAETIRTALLALPGVREVKVGLWRKRVRVRYEPARVQAAQIAELIVTAGFPIGDA